MDLRLLGPLEARFEGRPIELGPRKQRAVLAMLALEPGRTVSTDRLLEGLWGDDPPASAPKMVQLYVSRLRRLLEGNAASIITRGRGYELRLPDPDIVDAVRFERLVAKRPRDALALWRGDPLTDVADEPFAAEEIRRLEELRLRAAEMAIDADLEAGRHAEVVGELDALIAEQPLRERLHAQRMLALYRCGRQGDALGAYRAARATLVDQIGVEPGAELRRLEQAILAQSDELAAPAARREARLPAAPNRTIGRIHEVAVISARLRTGSVRLLTLTGPGGIGKTRLALEAARAVEADFADGAHLVSLAAVERPGDVAAEIVKALAIVVLPGESPGQAVERFLAAKQLLLIADNFEHLLAAAPFIAGLLGACPALTVFATSREPLSLHAEERYPVKALTAADAVTLFCERAQAHDPGFDAGDGNAAVVAEICRRVDGLPLAIELAAARCGLLSPDEIAERLDAALGAPGAGVRDAPARQQTLRATIDFSHNLLDDDEKQCFARFAVFAGGTTVAAAETITRAGLDTLDHLVAKNLLVRHAHAHAPTRLGMLETIRAYARERFASAADADEVLEAHAHYYLALAQRHGTQRALCGADAPQHLARLDAEIDNLHAALGWAIGAANAEFALALAAALDEYWVMRDRYADAIDWVDQALNLPGADSHPALRARALRTKARCLARATPEAEQPAVTAALEAISRRLGDPGILSQALQVRVYHELNAERLDVADTLADEALHWATAADDKWVLAEASAGKAIAAPSIADLRERVETAASLLTDVGNVYRLADLLTSAAYAALCLGSERDATDFAARATPIARGLDSRFTRMINSGNLGLAALLTGETDTASHAFREELMLCREMVVRGAAFEGLRGLAAVAVADGDDKRAATLVAAADTHRYANAEDPVEARLNDTFFKPARARCPSDVWHAAAREGSAFRFEEAIAYALEEPPV